MVYLTESTFLWLSSTGWTAVTGCGTLALAIVAVIQGFQLRKQKDQGRQQIEISNKNVAVAEEQARNAREQTELTRASVNAAIEVQKQTLRARVDDDAPRVSLFFDEKVGLHSGNSRGGRLNALDLGLLADGAISPAAHGAGLEYFLPRDQATFLWFTGSAMVTNDGPSSARVRLPSGARYFSGPSLFDPSENVPIPSMIENDGATTAVIPAGSKALFRWADGKTLGEWTKGHRHLGYLIPEQMIWIWLTVFGARSVGAIDTLNAYFAPEFLTDDPGVEGRWTVVEKGSLGKPTVVEMHRGYRREGAGTENLVVGDEYLREYLKQAGSVVDAT